MSDLADWPPSNFAVVGTGRGDRVPTHASQVSIGAVKNILVDCVRFECAFDAEKATCSFFMPDFLIAKKVAAILASHHGENLLGIGSMEIPEDRQ